MNATQIPELDDYESKKKKVTQYNNLVGSGGGSGPKGESLIQTMLRERETNLPISRKFDDTGDTVVITVNDESRKLKRDFKCKRIVLLNHMRYFEQYLKDDKSGDQLDISVHCDVKIFEWLMKYVDYYQNVADYGNIVQLYKVNY